MKKAGYQEIATMYPNRTSSVHNLNGSEKSIIALLAQQDSAHVQSIWPNDRISVTSMPGMAIALRS
ncbi:hypothetical protein [Mesorhizobium sp. M1374]